MLIDRFYTAFAALDAETMAACYAPDAVFRDPVFSLDSGADIGRMWTMLCRSVKADGADVWQLSHTVESESDTAAIARWTVRYRFSMTGRLVENRIESRFVLADGLIRRQDDSFDFWRWSRQALGPAGWLMGWSGALQDKVRAKAADRLGRFKG